MERSAPDVTVVVVVSVLFAEFESMEVVVTVAVLESVPPAEGAVTVVVIAGPVPGSRFVRVQVTVPVAWLQVQPVPVAETNPTPAGSVSVTAPPHPLSG